jgi:hypothetical protein
MLTLVVVGFCVALILLARRADDAPATSDTAVIESYTLLASKAQLLVGAYSRFQWHHPGPLYFFALAPFYALSGDRTAGLSAGAAALSVISIAIIIAVLHRRRPVLAVCTGIALVWFSWRAAEALASPWNPHVPLLPIAALIVVTADVMAGTAMLLPVVAVLASLAGQAHIALLPCAALLGILATCRGLVGATFGAARRTWRRALITTAAALLVTWALPIYEQFTSAPRGNVTELWRFFVEQSRHGQPLSTAVSAWSDMLAGPLRPDFYVAHGWPFIESPVLWAEWLTLAELSAALVYSVRAARRAEPFGCALGALIVVASGVALWSTTRIEDRIFDHDVFWISVIGVLNLALVLDLATARIAVRISSRSSRLAATAVLLLALCAGAAVSQLNRVVQGSFNPPTEARAARTLASDLAAYLNRANVVRPLIRIDQDAWGVAAGAILDLQKRGRIVSVEDDWVVMFTPVFRMTGREDAVITIAMPPEHLRLVDRHQPVISSVDPIYAHVSPVSGR